MAEKILVRGVNWIGDAVMSQPALTALKKALPDARLSLLVRPSVARLFETDPYIDELISYEDEFAGLMGRLRLANMLRKKEFSRAILFQNAFDAALIAFLAGIPERIGYNRDGRGFMLSQKIPCSGNDRKIHHIEYYLNIIRAMGLETVASAPRIFLEMKERTSALLKLSEMNRPILGLNPGAAYGSAKRWQPDRFAGIASRFMEDAAGSVVIFGGSNEVPVTQEIEEAVIRQGMVSNARIMNLAGRTSLRQLAALIACCDTLVTNDSGPMHISYAVGTPTVAVFGSTDPALTGPVGRGHSVVRSAVPCSPCFERTCKYKTLECMDGIMEAEVYAALKGVLPTRRAVFFDRDGTLCKDAHYLNNWKDLELLPGLENLRRLKDNRFLLIGVSNQSGIARGLVEEGFVKEVNKVFTDKFGLDEMYYCPHGPDEHCACRKPEPGMLANARAGHGIIFSNSYVVGDKDADMLLAKAVGAKGILVLTGKQIESRFADYTVKGLREAVDLIIANG